MKATPLVWFLFAAPGFVLGELNGCAAQHVDSIVINSRAGLGIELIYIPPGSFVMGRNVSGMENMFRPSGQSLDEGPAHPVEITKGFFIGRYQITAAQYCVFLNAVMERESTDKLILLNKWSNIEKDERGLFRPKLGYDETAVRTIPWEGAMRFCEWFSAETGWQFRLPTEAEWEFAARGSEGRVFPWGNKESGVQNSNGDRPVGFFKHNVTPEGVADMFNHIGDWTSDFYAAMYSADPQLDPRGPEAAVITSGGDLGHVLRQSRYSLFERSPGKASNAAGVYGFRVVLQIEKPNSKEENK